MEPKAFYFLYFPLSADNKLHYEFIFNGRSLEISLHFEGQYEKRVDVMREIISKSELSLNLRENPGRWKGCSYVCDSALDPAVILNYMEYLIEISMPILLKYRLVRDDIFFQSPYFKSAIA